MAPISPYSHRASIRAETDAERENARLLVRVEQLERTNVALDRHARAMSHDLRAPIATTISSLKLISQYGERIEEADQKHLIDRATIRLGELVDQMDALLDEALIDATASGMGSADVGTALQWALTTLAQTDAERLTVIVEELPRVLARRVALRQVLQNVISNTLRHNEGRSVSLHLSGELQDDRVVFVLEDDGKGFPDNLAELLENERSGGQGHGIGLTSIKLAVERLGGSVAFENGPRGGARVTIELAAADADEADRL